MRYQIATDLKTRTGVPAGKDARLVNSYVETKGDQSVVRKRPIAQGGVAVGTGVAQGGYGTVLFYGDTASVISSSTGTTWSGSTPYVTGDHVSYNFADYWATTSNTGSTPPSANWSQDYVPPEPPYVPNSWTLRTIAAGYWTKVAWNGTVYCAIDGTSNNIAYSTNGISWTIVATSAIGSGDICWDGTQFCIVGNGYASFLTSANGITWSAPNLGDLIYPGIVVGKTTVIVNISIGNSGGLATASTNGGVAFNPVTIPSLIPGTQHYVAAVWNGTVFCAIASLNTTATSTDGINWTGHAMAVSGSWVDIAWNGTLFCAIASNGATATSTDGITWAATGNLPTASTWRAIAWNGATFMAITLGNTKSATSTNGAVWQSVTLPATSNWSDIASNGHDFCIVSTTNSTNVATTP